MNTSYFKNLSGLAAAGAIAGFSIPAHATLQIIASVNGVAAPLCVDNAACDTNPAVGIIQVPNGSLNGVEVNGSIQTSTGTAANPGRDILNTSSLSIINLTDTTKTVTVVVSDTDFRGPVASFGTAGSGTWQTAVGSTITLNWYNNPANGQGADTPTDTPGNLIDTFSFTATAEADSFAHNGAGPMSDTGPFSMTEEAVFTLMPGAELVSRGQAEVKTAIPEPSTWAMPLMGFAGLGFAGYRARRRSAGLRA